MARGAEGHRAAAKERARDAYRQRDPLRAPVHALHVHVRAEHRDPAARVAVRLEPLEEALRVVEDGAAGVEAERPVCRGARRSSAGARLGAGSGERRRRGTYRARSWAPPSPPFASTGSSTCGPSVLNAVQQPVPSPIGHNRRARARGGGLTKLCPNLRFADGGSGLGAVVLSICNFAGCVVRGRTSGVSIAGGATEPQHRIDVRRCPPARGPRRSSSSARSGCDSRRPRTAP